MRGFGAVYRKLRKPGVWLALLAILIHTATPALAQVSASQSGVYAAVICSGDESRTIYLDADGNLTHAPAQQSPHEHCAACLHHVAPLPVISSQAAPRVVSIELAVPASPAVEAATYPTGLPPRAPPA